jgi:SAM-dependent methyltransferase
LHKLVRNVFGFKGTKFSGEKLVNAESVRDRHLRICQILHHQIQAVAGGRKDVACEIGAGDCLASADLLLGSGFQKVYIVEKPSPSLAGEQVALLREIAGQADLPNQLDVLSPEDPCRLNSQRVVLLDKYFEDTTLPEPVDLIVSFDVLEHVEDLPAFFRNCHQALREGGVMIHKFDLSGHSLLEDPIPPLDFQTYPDWLYQLMHPKYSRAVRNFIDAFTGEIQRQGFHNLQITPIRKADADYVAEIRPHLRTAARHLSSDDLAILDVVITASK